MKSPVATLTPPGVATGQAPVGLGEGNAQPDRTCRVCPDPGTLALEILNPSGAAMDRYAPLCPECLSLILCGAPVDRYSNGAPSWREVRL